MLKKSIAAVGVALMLQGLAQAADTAAADSPSADSGSDAKAQAAPAGTWAAQGQLGLIITSSNTTTKSGNASFNAAHAMGLWTLSGGFSGLYASTGHYSTQQDTNANLQADLALSKRTFWFSNARWDRNLFTGFEYQDSVATGAGYNFVQTPATQFAGELGVGYRIEHPETLTTGALGNVTSRVLEPIQRNAVLQAGLNYAHSITEST
jgi:putative salt-induced outer membrane protein YdiY